MKNPHIIVGAPRRCLCGIYDGQVISCADVIETLNKVEDQTRDESDLTRLVAVMKPLIQECD